MEPNNIFESTWLGRPAISSTYNLDDNPIGRRIVTMDWQDRDQFEIKLIEGDGRTHEFRIFRHYTLQNPTAAEVDAQIAELAELSKTLKSLKPAYVSVVQSRKKFF